MILFENFMIPHIISKALIGIKCSTIMAPNNRRAVSQLNSGTEKLKVLKAKKRKFGKKVQLEIRPVLIELSLENSGQLQKAYFLTLSPNDARKPIVF